MSAATTPPIIVRRAIFRLPARLDYAALPRVIYTDPELAQVGMTEAEARDAGLAAARAALRRSPRTTAPSPNGTPPGWSSWWSARGRLLGAGILAPHAGEMIGQWALAIARACVCPHSPA